MIIDIFPVDDYLVLMCLDRMVLQDSRPFSVVGCKKLVQVGNWCLLARHLDTYPREPLSRPKYVNTL